MFPVAPYLGSIQLGESEQPLALTRAAKASCPDCAIVFYMHLLAYNLIRCLMWQAAAQHSRPLHRISFAGTVDRLNALKPCLQLYGTSDRGQRLYALLLRWTADDLVAHRPARLEPRAVKRRAKQYDLLNRPRSKMRKALLRG